MKEKIRIIIPVFLIIYPIINYFILVFYFAVNIPIWDDYDAILDYLNTAADTRYGLIFSQLNEHRIAFTRIVTECFYLLSGKIDFKYLTYIGSSALIFLLFLLFKLFRAEKNRLIFFIPVSYLLFNARPWENITGAMASLQYNYVLLFSLLSLYFWNHKAKYGFLFSYFFGIVAAYTSGNGILVFILIIFWEVTRILPNVHLKPNQTSNILWSINKKSVILFLITILVFYLYFNGYIKPSHHPGITKALLQPDVLFRYFGILLGSFMGHTTLLGKTIAFATGFIEILIFILLSYKRYDLKNPVVYYFLCFLFATIFSASLFRSAFGVEQALTSRYRIFSTVVLITEYIAIIDLYGYIFESKRKLVFILILLSVFYNLGTIKFSLPALSIRKNMLVEGMKTWERTGKGLFYGNQERASEILKQSIRNRCYQIPDYRQ